MYSPPATPVHGNVFNPCNLDHNPVLAKAYGHIMRIMETNDSDTNKIRLIKAIFEGAIEEQDRCIEELGKK